MDALIQMESDFLLFIQDFIRHDFMDGFWIFITSLANGGWFWIALSLVLCCFPQTRKAGIAGLCSLLLGAFITNVWLKNAVARPRPFTQIPQLSLLVGIPHDWSFPSGHSTASFAAAGSYLWMLPRRRYGIAALILASLISFSRLYVGIHYPTDVLCGILIGLLGSWIVYQCWLYLQKRKNLRGSDQSS